MQNNLNLTFESQFALLNYFQVGRIAYLRYDPEFDSSQTIGWLIELYKLGKFQIEDKIQESTSGNINKHHPCVFTYKSHGQITDLCLRRVS